MGEFENTRKNHARAMDSMQASLESEQRAKAEALRMKKKLEGDINELEIALDHANKANSEAQKAIKRYQGQHREAECAYEEEQRQRQEMAEKASLADRRANALAGEMEEARSLLDSAERGKRQTEAELAESRNAVQEMSTINSKASAEKRTLEGAVHTMHAEIDDMLHLAKNSEEKAKKAMVDAARLADELRSEQDHTTTQSKAKRSLESQLGELENKFAEANENAMRGGRAAMAKLETRIRELEIELGNVQAHTGENAKGYQKSERRGKELAFQIDEDKKNQDRMAELATKLQQKIKTYKKQKKLLHLILPSSARRNKSLRRPRSVQGWQRLSSQLITRQPKSLIDDTFERMDHDLATAQHKVCPLQYSNSDPILPQTNTLV